MSEHWEPGDVVLAADGCIWWRPAIITDFPWNLVYAADPDGPKHRSATSEHVPERPLTLLVRNGQPVLGSRWTPGAPAADPRYSTVEDRERMGVQGKRWPRVGLQPASGR